MNCKGAWLKKDLVEYFGVSFVTNKYKEHRETCLFEYEKSQFPATMPYTENRKIVLKYTNENTKYNQQIYEEKKKLKYLPIILEDAEKNEEHALEVFRLEGLVRINDFKIRSAMQYQHVRDGRAVISTKRYFPCSKTECRGFVCNSTWECGLCEMKVCSECLEEKLEGHECVEDTVSNINMLKKDSKNCPKCMALIHKISGCSQMFCTMCHTAFEYYTGAIVDRGIHNPHYYEYLRRRDGVVPRNEDDAEACRDGEIPGYWNISNKFNTENNELMTRVYTLIVHISNVELRKYRVFPETIHTHMHLRSDYLLGLIGKYEFKKKLQMNEKAREKNTDISGILRTFFLVAIDLLNAANNETFRAEVENLRAYTNTSMYENVVDVYKCVAPIINKSWNIQSSVHSVRNSSN